MILNPKSTEIESRVRHFHLLDLDKEGSGVGCHIESFILKSIAERSRGVRATHGGDAAGVGFDAQSEPEYVNDNSGKVGTQQCDLFT